MPCRTTPTIAVPDLPSGYGFGAAIPVFSGDIAFCCKTPPFPFATPPVTLGAGVQVPAPILALAAAGKRTLFAWVRQRQIKCPRDP